MLRPGILYVYTVGLAAIVGNSGTPRSRQFAGDLVVPAVPSAGRVASTSRTNFIQPPTLAAASGKNMSFQSAGGFSMVPTLVMISAEVQVFTRSKV
jgi:hypothetical protein